MLQLATTQDTITKKEWVLMTAHESSENKFPLEGKGGLKMLK